VKKGQTISIQWYPKDILSSLRVAMMNLSEEGAYRRALDFCWLNGHIPSDPKQLAKLIGKGCTLKIAEVVRGMFVENPNDSSQMIHERLEEERTKQIEYRKKKSLAGKEGNKKRWNDKKEIAETSHSDRKDVANESHSDYFANRKQSLSNSNSNSNNISSSKDGLENEKSELVPKPSERLVSRFAVTWSIKAKNSGVPHEKLDEQLKLFDDHYLEFDFADDKHLLNCWGIWCMNYDKKSGQSKNFNTNGKQKGGNSEEKPTFKKSKPADEYF
jgi:hypothetical protein